MPLFGEQKRKYQREWVAKRKTEWFTGKWCVFCGEDEDLTLDHIDPFFKTTHKIWSWSKVRRDEELTKCQVLCLPCHKFKTTQDRGWQPNTYWR